jgi:hypothetical protein
VDDDLRGSIDRLVRSGGRLVVHGAGGAVLELEQPGSRFGILEVRGRLTIPGGDGPIDAAVPSGWTDPTVTQRLGREIRLHPSAPPGDGSQIRTRTWRVPPVLASELVGDVVAALGEVSALDFQPLATRERARTEPSARPGPAPDPRSVADDADEEPRDQHPRSGRTLPTPLRAILVVALVAVVGFVWAGMIRGAPRQPTAVGRPAGSALAAATAPASPAPPEPTPIPPSPIPEPIQSRLATASTEDPSAPATAAIDGDPITAWHAAFGVPQWIEITLETPSTVTEVLLLIAQPEPGISRHTIQVGQAGAALHVMGVVDQQTADGNVITFKPATPLTNVERIRIETLATPANAGWYEVIVR